MHASSALALCEHLEPVVAIAWKVVQVNHITIMYSCYPLQMRHNRGKQLQQSSASASPVAGSLRFPTLSIKYSNNFRTPFVSIPKPRQCTNHHIPLCDAENRKKTA
jgi:hypothetical protein